LVDSGRREAGASALIVLLVVCMYFALLIPYVVHSNLNRAGFVIFSEDVPIESLPNSIRSFIAFRDKPVVILIKQQKPTWIARSVTEWTIALITPRKFPRGAFIEFMYPVAQMYVNWRDYPFGQIFDELVIADVVREIEQYKVGVEYILSSPYGSVIFALSSADYYFGPFLFALIAYLFKKRPTLWSIVMIPWCYSIQTLLYNTLAILHYNYVPGELKLFGFLFMPLTPVVLLVWAWERTPPGQVVAEKLFTFRIGESNEQETQ